MWKNTQWHSYTKIIIANVAVVAKGRVRDVLSYLLLFYFFFIFF